METDFRTPTAQLLEKKLGDCNAQELLEFRRLIEVELSTRRNRLRDELSAIDKAGFAAAKAPRKAKARKGVGPGPEMGGA